jgi:hypothetical protein
MVEDTGSTKIRLIDPGASPRRVLRFAPSRGTSARMTAQMKVGVSFDLGGSQIPIQMPPMDMSFDVLVADVTTATFVTVSTLTAVDLDENAPSTLGPAFNEGVQRMVGMRVTQRLNRNGLVESSETTLPDGAAPQLQQTMDSMKQSMSEMNPGFPEKAIGVGARWVVTTHPENNAIAVDQSTTYELASLEGDRGTVSIDLVQSAEPQDVKVPNTTGMQTHLESLASHGTGTISFDLARAVPPASNFAMSTDMDMTITSRSGQTTKARMKMTIEMIESSAAVEN